jgi:hypothetical protein
MPSMPNVAQASVALVLTAHNWMATPLRARGTLMQYPDERHAQFPKKNPARNSITHKAWGDLCRNVPEAQLGPLPPTYPTPPSSPPRPQGGAPEGKRRLWASA